MNYELIKKKIQAEIDVSTNVGDIRIYNFVLNEVLYGDEQATDDFMLSEHGGYTPGQLQKIKYTKNYHAKNRQRSIIPISAF